MLIDAGVEHSNVGTDCLLDQRDKIPEWLRAEMMFLPEALGRIPALRLCDHPIASIAWSSR
ncbi:hypothetical protein ACFWF7_16080 [Nocardia sp. NPDC060256]|uniref:hypothetical protein n=1 Tax=Nocardia sp. NPDC060256 TaxID=3347086 RepID=UPI0036481161